MAIHQANHARIQSLHQTADALDNQIKTTLGLLADTRKELLNQPVTSFPDSSRNVPFDELLMYAKYIGRYTVPPTFRERMDVNAIESQERPALPESKLSNGGTPLLPDPSEDIGKETGSDGEAPPPTTNPYFQKLQEDLVREKQPELPWEPWPSAETIWVGNLKIIQNQIAAGMDPSTVLSPEEQEKEELKKVQDEEQKKRDQERHDADERKRQENAHRQRMQQGHGQQQQQQQQEAEVDEFNLYDPDEED